MPPARCCNALDLESVWRRLSVGGERNNGQKGRRVVTRRGLMVEGGSGEFQVQENSRRTMCRLVHLPLSFQAGVGACLIFLPPHTHAQPTLFFFCCLV